MPRRPAPTDPAPADPVLTQAIPTARALPLRPAVCLLHPALLFALAGLALNDHLLKGLFPGVVTGKLSDALGLFAFPLLVWAGLDRLGLGARTELGSRRRLVAIAGLTGLAFTGLKLLSAVRAAFVGAYAGLGVRASVAPDATDLFCLPVLLGAIAVGRGRRNLQRACASFRASGQLHRFAGLVVLALGAAVSAASSWSPPRPVRAQIVKDASEFAVVHDRRVYSDRPLRVVLPDADYREVRVFARADDSDETRAARAADPAKRTWHAVAPVVEHRAGDPVLGRRPVELWIPRSTGGWGSGAWEPLATGPATGLRPPDAFGPPGNHGHWGYRIEVVRADGTEASAAIAVELEEVRR